MNVCSVKFKDSGKSYFFRYEDMKLNNNVTVIVETEKGEQFAKVNSTNVELNGKIDPENMKHVIRISTKQDYSKYLKNLKDAADALIDIRKLADNLGLKMRIIDSSYTFDRKQLTFNFLSDDRVDFRDLVKELASKYKTRIELHQIGVRDKSKEIGGLGQCGRELCCSSCLSSMDTISINMAKNQNIALNPSKINGACGRLLCCLAYEDDVYTEHRKQLPKMGSIIKNDDGSGKVVSLDVLNKKYTLLIDGERKEYESK